MKIIAIVECSCGNESVGEMWKEVKVFEPTNTLQSVFAWADSVGTHHNHANITLALESEKPLPDADNVLIKKESASADLWRKLAR